MIVARGPSIDADFEAKDGRGQLYILTGHKAVEIQGSKNLSLLIV